MTGDEQQTNGGNAAGGNTPAPTPNGSANPTETVEYWKKQAESWENRYSGQQTAMNKKVEDANKWQKQFLEKNTEFEDLKSTKEGELTDWQKKHQTLEQQAAEQAKKLQTYELKDKVRSLVYSKDFSELANDFEADPLFQAGVLSMAAQNPDETALKDALTKSLATRQGRAAAAEQGALAGATSAPPAAGGNTSTATEEQIIAQLKKAAIGSPEYDALMKKWQEARKRKT